jgi:putative phage-type endonuclease
MTQAYPVTLASSSPFDDFCQSTGVTQDDRERWLVARRSGLGGSEVAAILGIHPYRSALEVYADKCGLLPPEGETSEVARWGTIFEGPIVDEFARRTGREVVRSNELLRSRLRPWQTVTPDAIQYSGVPKGCSGPGLAEVKTTGYGDWEEQVPAHVLVQVQHGLAVTGAEWQTLIWLPFPERKLAWRDLLPHAEFQALLLERVDAFWTRVLDRRPPDADGSDSARRALFALDPELVEECVELEDADAIADELEEISAQQTRLEARKALISNRVLQALGECKVGLLEDGRYWNSWRVDPREETCPHCAGVTRTVNGFRASRLMKPRKKPHGRAIETRRLDMAVDGELAKLIAASVEGRSP